MATDQTAVNVLAAIKREVTHGVMAASGGGGIQLRLLDSPGLKLDTSTVLSGESRPSRVRGMARNAGRSVAGSYNLEYTVGGAIDELLGGVQRRLWSASFAITTSGAFAAATLTIATVGANQTLTASAGDFMVAGLMVGDIITPSGMTTPANNAFRLRIIALSATVITVAGTYLTAGAQAAWMLTRAKKLTTSGIPSGHSYTVDQHDLDADNGNGESEVFTGCIPTQLQISIRPKAIATVAVTFMGLNHTVFASVASPWLTGASLTTGKPLVSIDATVRQSGTQVLKVTSMDLTIALDAAGQDVIGSSASPAVYPGDATYGGSISVIREDLSRLTMADAETEFDLAALFTEPNSGTPSAFSGFYMPRVKFGTVDAPFRGSTGAKIETIPLIISERELATGYDDSAINFFSSAA